jgi:hypothetical protein
LFGKQKNEKEKEEHPRKQRKKEEHPRKQRKKEKKGVSDYN